MKAKEHGSGQKIMAYDVKLRKMVVMMNPKEVTFGKGRRAWKGTSAESGIGVFRIKSKND